MMTMSLLMAKAPITPSKENDASSISRYMNAPNHAFATPCASVCFSVSCKYEERASTATKVANHAIPLTRTVTLSSIGMSACNTNNTVIAINTSTASNFPTLIKYFSIVCIQCISLRGSRINLRNTINKNIPPNDAIAAWELIRYAAY